MTRLVDALKDVGETFDLFQKGEIGRCDSTTSAVLVPNLVPSTFCHVPDVVPDVDSNGLGQEVGASLPEELNMIDPDDPELQIAPTDEKVDVRAKFALKRMLNDPLMAVDAARLILGLKSKRLDRTPGKPLAGIFGDDLKKAVDVARDHGTERWLLVPKGEDAALVLVNESTGKDPLNDPPTVIFRGDTPDISKQTGRLDAALQEASKTFAFFQDDRLVLCASSPSAESVSNLVPPSFCRIQGQDLLVVVTEEGTQPPSPVFKAKVQVVGPSPSINFTELSTDPSGHALFQNLAHGSYQVTTSKKGFEDSVTVVHLTKEAKQVVLFADEDNPKTPTEEQYRVTIPLAPLKSKKPVNNPKIRIFLVYDRAKGKTPVASNKQSNSLAIKWKDVWFQWRLEGGFAQTKLDLTIKHKTAGTLFYQNEIRDYSKHNPAPYVDNEFATNLTMLSAPYGVVMCELEMKQQSGQSIQKMSLELKLSDVPNKAPTVNAGTNITITLPSSTVTLTGSVSDDALPNPPAAVTTAWSLFKGPGTVTFGNASAVTTTATFTTAGTYELRLTANDSKLTSHDNVTITVKLPTLPSSGPYKILPIPTAKVKKNNLFWQHVDAEIAASSSGVAMFKDGDLLYVTLNPKIMRIIRRTSTELFSTTVKHNVVTQNLKVATNGNPFGLTKIGMADVLSGNDPVDPSETTPEGQVIESSSVVVNNSEPDRFHIAFTLTSTAFTFGQGDPPSSADAALGGLGPIIIGGLRFGIGNQYRSGVPKGAPKTGSPGPKFKPFLVQRNNNTYKALANLGPSVGKGVVALSSKKNVLLVLVQPDSVTPGSTLDKLRDKLVAIGIDDAVFLDGSDSVLLVVDHIFRVHQGQDKDEATTIGLGFN